MKPGGLGVKMLGGKRRRRSITLTFKSTSNHNGFSSTHTFAGMALSTTGYNVVAIGFRTSTSGAVSSVTVDGVAATLAVAAMNAANAGAEIWVAASSGNATGTVTVVFASGAERSGMAVYGMVGAGSATPTATATDTTSPIAQSLAINAGGCAIGAYFSIDTATATWGSMTEDVDAQVDTQLYTMASTVTPGTPEITVTPSAGPNGPAAAFAAFGP